MSKRERSRSPSPSSLVKLHVKNLPLNFTQDQLSQVFRSFGKVYDTKIIRKGSNGQPLRDCVYGFVALENMDIANHAMKSLNSSGWSINFSKESLQRKPAPPNPEVHKNLYPSEKSFQDNASNTNIMLSNVARSHPTHMVDQAKLQNFISEHHPNAQVLLAVPERFKGAFMVREVWVGNIAPSTEKQGLFDAFKHFGEIEGVEMFSSKGFAFVKFRKVLAATKAYEFGEGTLVEGRSVKITFADPSRRQDIVGDSPIGETGNDSVPDDGVRSLVFEYPADGFVPGEGILKEVCSRYGVVKRICIRQGSGNYRPHAFVDFERGSQAAEARKKLYIEDYDGSRRRELGHPSIDISFKNTNNIVNKHNIKPVTRPEPTSEVSQLARKLMEQPAGYLNILKFQPGSVFPPMVNPNLFPSIPHSSIPPSARVPLVNNQISKSEANPSVSPPIFVPSMPEANPSIGTVVWSGFMTRSKKYRVGIDATLVQGNDDCFPSSLYHINISHRVQLSEITKYFVIALVTIEASNETQQELFNEYLKYFSSKQRAGFIAMKSSVLYICPPIEEAKKMYPEIKDSQLLGVFLDTTKKPEKSKDPHLEEILKLLKNPEALKHSETIAQFIK